MAVPTASITNPLSLPVSLTLANKTAIVTGASRGIGAGIARELARRGAKVALVYRAVTSTPLAQKIADQIRDDGGKATLVQADLNEPDCGKIVIEGALRGLGVEVIDVLVNNAAVDPPLHDTKDFDAGFFEEMMNTNVRAPLLLVQAMIPHLPPRNGRIINISSTLSRSPAPQLSIYSATKAALDALTRAWALEFGRSHTLTSNSVTLGWIDTESTDLLTEDQKAPLLELPAAAKRFGKVEEVCEVVSWLASEGSSWVTGASVGCSGGSVFV